MYCIHTYTQRSENFNRKLRKSTYLHIYFWRTRTHTHSDKSDYYILYKQADLIFYAIVKGAVSGGGGRIGAISLEMNVVVKKNPLKPSLFWFEILF